MLKRSERANKNSQIISIIKKGNRIETESLRVSVKNSKGTRFQGTVICAKSVDRKASVRNLLKRRARELLKTTIRQKFPSSEIVVSVKQRAKNKTLAEMRQELKYELHI